MGPRNLISNDEEGVEGVPHSGVFQTPLNSRKYIELNKNKKYHK
jgi:hypothetical protein